MRILEETLLGLVSQRIITALPWLKNGLNFMRVGYFFLLIYLKQKKDNKTKGNKEKWMEIKNT